MTSLANSNNTSKKKKQNNIENTIEPDYNGYDVDELIVTKRVQIDKLKDLLGDDLPKPTPKIFPYYDDIFYLRYILSFETAEASVEPIKETIKFRHHTPKFADMLTKVKNGKWEFEPIVDASLLFQVAGLSDAKIDHGPLVIIRPGKSKSALQFDHMTYEEMHLLHFAYREIAFIQCDKATRESRKIVKQLLIMDLTDVSISEMSDRRGQKVFVPVAKASANYFPQMQHKFVMVNTPGWISAIFGLMKSIMPARNFNKLGLCKSKVKLEDGDISKCPFASKYLNPSLLPRFLGGTMEDKDLHYSLKGDRLCNAARKDGSKNTTNHNIEKDLAYEKINVSRRSKKTIEYVIPSKDIEISWKFLLHGYNIKMSAVLLNKSSNNNVKEKKPKDKEEEKIIQVFREISKKDGKIKAENGLIKGVWRSNSPGILRITFDNSYSMLRPKTMNYSIKLNERNQQNNNINTSKNIKEEEMKYDESNKEMKINNTQ